MFNYLVFNSLVAHVSLVALLVKNPPAMWETWVRSLGWEDPLENETATHSSILAWRIPWTLESMGLQRVGHDWETFTFTSLVAKPEMNLPAMQETWVQFLGQEDTLEKEMAIHSSSCLGSPMDRGAMGLQKVRHNWVIHTFTFTWLLTGIKKPWILYSQNRQYFDDYNCEQW